MIVVKDSDDLSKQVFEIVYDILHKKYKRNMYLEPKLAD